MNTYASLLAIVAVIPACAAGAGRRACPRPPCIRVGFDWLVCAYPNDGLRLSAGGAGESAEGATAWSWTRAGMSF